MLIPTNKHIFTLPQKNMEYAEQFNNSIKIDFSKISQFQQGQTPHKIKLCKQQSCGVFLSILDRNMLLTSRNYIENYDIFSQTQRLKKNELNQNSKDQMVWICRFCGKHQVISLQCSEFVQKPTKFLVDSQGNSKNQESLVLFLIDSSSSMQQCYSSFDNKNQQLLLDLVKNSQLVKKNRLRQTQYLKKISRIYQGGQVSQNKNSVTKKQLLLGLVSKVVRQMKIHVRSQKNEQKRKIGFIFFNQNIFLAADGKNSNFPIITDVNYQTSSFNADQYLDKDISKDRFKPTRFDRFEDLFNIGASFGHLYYSTIKNFAPDQMNLDQVRSSGKTALGPALAIALGIISKHNQGSTIVVVTDGKANYGILESQNQYQQSYNMVRKSLTDMKCSLGLLEWRQNDSNNNQIEQNNQKSISWRKPNLQYNPNQNRHLDKFIKNNKQISKKIEITLQTDSDAIQTNIELLQQMAFRRIVGVVYEIKFVASKQFIQFEKSKFQDTILNQMNLIQSDKTVWVNVKINKQKIVEEDYQYPVATQFILKYNDVQNQKTYCFVSQIEQTLSKSFKKIVQYVNFANLQQYFDNQDIKNYSQKNSIRSIQRTIREYVRDQSLSIKSKHRLEFADINKSNDVHKKSVKSRHVSGSQKGEGSS